MAETKSTPDVVDAVDGEEGEAGGFMTAGRLEAFTDGVIAVIITIMVLELKAPEAANAAALFAGWHIFVAYIVSFAFVAIYWVNHHHLLHIAKRIGAPTLWLNIHWLFWLSLYPFATSYVSETNVAPFSVALYGAVATLTAISYGLLANDLIRRNRHSETLARIARRRSRAGMLSVLCNVLVIPLAYFNVTAAVILLLVPAGIYFMPARQVESAT